MPKLKAMTLEQYLEDNYGDDGITLKDQMARLGSNADNAVGFVYAHANLNSNRYWETMKIEPGFAHDNMHKDIFERCRTWVLSKIK